MIIDFHSHILPGIDDGSKNREMSLAMLAKAKETGIDTIVASPHFYGEAMQLNYFLEQREQAFLELKINKRENLPRFLLSAEVLYFPNIAQAEGIERLCIENTQLFLLEMPFLSWSKTEVKQIEELLNRGLIPILVHPERYFAYPGNLKILGEIMQFPIYLQFNAEAFLNWRMRRKLLKLLKKYPNVLLGSDCHNLDTRPQNLIEGRKVIDRKMGKEQLQLIDDLGYTLLKDALRQE